MDKISLYVLDTRKFTFSDLLNFTGYSEDEVSFLNRFRVLEVKKEKLISYYFKKKYVGEYSFNEHNKPISDKVFFNVSHSKGVVVIALSNSYDVGVDIEVIKSKDEDLVKYVCSDEEYKFVKNEFDFLSIWTNKESLVKCIGTGIKNNIKAIPSLPFNGKKEYDGKTFYSKIIKFNDSIISITLKSEEEFDYIMNVEDIKHD